MNPPPEIRCALGVDIGGTSLRCGLVRASGAIFRGSLRKVTIDSKGDRESILGTFAAPLKELLFHSVTPGFLCGHRSRYVRPLDYAGPFVHGASIRMSDLWGRIKDELRRRLKLPEEGPMIFEVDAWAFARGEAWKGAGKGYRRILAITLGSGMGSAFVADGRLLSEGPGVPSPYGWMGGLPYGVGIVDDQFSRRGILARYRFLTGHPLSPGKDVKDLAARARRGDALCKELFGQFGTELGRVLLPTIQQFHPECLVFGGRISRSFDLFGDSVKQALEGQAPGLRKISVARSISLSAIRGGARLAFENTRQAASSSSEKESCFSCCELPRYSAEGLAVSLSIQFSDVDPHGNGVYVDKILNPGNRDEGSAGARQKIPTNTSNSNRSFDQVLRTVRPITILRGSHPDSMSRKITGG
jgi:glucokinase